MRGNFGMDDFARFSCTEPAKMLFLKHIYTPFSMSYKGFTGDSFSIQRRLVNENYHTGDQGNRL